MATDNRTANSAGRRLARWRQQGHGWRRVAVAAIGALVLAGTPAAAVLARPATRGRARPPAHAAGPGGGVGVAPAVHGHAADSSGGVGVAPAPPSPARTISLDCPSPSLGGKLPTLVYLPAGYANSQTRYPVIYFLHGLPANPSSYQYNGFVAASLVTTKKQAIVVTPQGARSADSDREYLDWSADENWPQAISHDLVTCIDRRYRTIASRDGRALTGLSAGGYGAFNIGLRTLSVFGAVESWSGYFAATNPAGTEVLNLGSPQANAAAAVPTNAQLTAELGRYQSYIAFYVGAQDPHFLQDNQAFNATLNAGGIGHVFAIYPGGHSGSLWRSEAPAWLSHALDYLAELRAHRAPPTTGPTGASGATGTSGPTGATS